MPWDRDRMQMECSAGSRCGPLAANAVHRPVGRLAPRRRMPTTDEQAGGDREARSTKLTPLTGPSARMVREGGCRRQGQSYQNSKRSCYAGADGASMETDRSVSWSGWRPGPGQRDQRIAASPQVVTGRLPAVGRRLGAARPKTSSQVSAFADHRDHLRRQPRERSSRWPAEPGRLMACSVRPARQHRRARWLIATALAISRPWGQRPML
jgi:hypothetical protein